MLLLLLLLLLLDFCEDLFDGVTLALLVDVSEFLAALLEGLLLLLERGLIRLLEVSLALAELLTLEMSATLLLSL